VVVPLAKVGYGARGLASLPLGVFLVMAGIQARAGEARSWGGALQALEGQPFGSWALGLVAAGLIAFGLFGLVEARYRRIRPPPEITP
jgi:TctA family transporter